MDGVLNRRALFIFAVQYPQNNLLLVWQKGMRITQSHSLNRDEEHAPVVMARPPYLPPSTSVRFVVVASPPSYY